MRIAFEEPFYVGIGVCSHNKDVTEKADFSNVELVAPLPAVSGQTVLYSSLETQSIASTDRRVVFLTTSRIEAPNWLRDGNTLIYNSGGRIYQIPASGGEPKPIDTGFATKCNNDHGISPDGTLLAISDQSQGAGSRSFTRCRSQAGRPSSSPRLARRTGTAGRPTARHWPTAPSATASSTSTPSPSTAARKRG